MKELTIEEKAKRYDMAIEKAKEINNEHKAQPFDVMLKVFPELKELEDERVRKEIISALKYANHKGVYDKHIAWLEKQDKQKPINKVEHKFEMGDWVVFNNKHQSIYQVEKIEDGYYILRHTHGGTFRVCVLHDESLRLWTVQDAKDGDILVFDNKVIVMFEYWCIGTAFHSYCHIKNGVFLVSEKDTPHIWEGKGFNPANKAQRDFLFQKMGEAGYEWDDKKKLKKRI